MHLFSATLTTKL